MTVITQLKINNKTNIPLLFRKIIRMIAKCKRTNIPIVIIPGNKSPTIEGQGYYHTTLSGKTIVRFPNAYGWKTQYHPSTIRVEVGQDWFNSNFTINQFRLDKLKAFS